MKYIHYGDNKFDKNKFNPIVNIPEFVKPYGGLWASRENAEYGWKDWCTDNEFHTDNFKKSFTFTLTPHAKILVIDNSNQLEQLPKNANAKIVANLWSCLDYEELSKNYDAIEVLISEDYKLYDKLYGWDCDSILVMNSNIIEIEENINGK